MSGKEGPSCASCPVAACYPSIRADEQPTIDKAPGFCPMKCMPEVTAKAISEYDVPELKEFARQASLQEGECYERLPDGIRTRNPRILELVEFSRKCGYRKLGIAFCIGLRNEAKLLAELLENKGFEVVSVVCKVGVVPKERIGIRPEEKIAEPDKWESMCNPVAQAEILNAAGVDLAIMLGLCIGHDTLFIKYCRVPMTVIAVKDRVTGHNPLAALYTSNSYYRRLMTKDMVK